MSSLDTLTKPEEPNAYIAAGPVPANPKQRSGYLPTLDGWRAIAILWVLEGHSQLWSHGWLSNNWLRETDYRGVQLFFALSGFLICKRLLREEDRFGSISLRSFYTRRLFRIQPAAMTFLCVVVVLSVADVIPRFWPGILGAALMVRNIWPLKLSAGYWYTAHFWSLAVEEHFYLLLPGFLVLFRRNRLAILSATAIVLEIWRIVVFSTPKLRWGLSWQVGQRTDMVLGGLLLGSVFAVALGNRRIYSLAGSLLRPWVALLFMVVLFFELQRHHSSAAQSADILVYPVLIVATVLHANSWTGRLLELAPLRFVGRISYSLYLWQQLFLDPDASVRLRFLHAHVLVCWCAAFACAIASYYLIETPLIRRGHRIAQRFDLQPRSAGTKT